MTQNVSEVVLRVFQALFNPYQFDCFLPALITLGHNLEIRQSPANHLETLEKIINSAEEY
jgi:hypothetical protein